MKKIVSLALLFFCFHSAFAQVDSLVQRIFLIGDAGEMHGDGHPVIDWLKKNATFDDKTAVVFLGDNIYPYGMPVEGDPSYPAAKRVIDYQISLVKDSKAKAFFIPGNHDWANGKMIGWQQVLNQINYINGLELNNVQAWPQEGCPGPVEMELNEKVLLVLMDSQWFLHLHDKPGPGSTCESKTIDEFATNLREMLAAHPNQMVLLAMHHPMYSYGVHGGDYTWRSHIFPFADAIPGLYIPLPIIGSIYPISRGVFGNIQDVKHPLYRGMAHTIEDIIKEHPNVIVAAGHDHSLQMIRKDSIPYIVSGSGTNLSRVKQKTGSKARTEFTDLQYGFSSVEVRKSGRVDIKFYNINSLDLDNPTFITYSKPIPKPVETTAQVDTLIGPLKDFVTVAANPKLKGNAFKRFFIGGNYREEWTTPVTAPVLDLSKEQGGLHPVRMGGGKQTKSLRLEEKDGKEWVLRSIEKFPEAAIPTDLRAGFTKDIVEDAISASYPFASLSIAPLARASNLPVIRRKLVYVPDDPRLERFRKGFANTLAILEEREPEHIKKTYNTDDLVLRLAKDNDDHVDQKAVLRARLMDNFIMDFDRHEDQWRWATRDTGKGKIYFPIPRDHDQAFYVNQGLIPFYVRKPWYVPEIQGFQAKTHDIKTFNRVARNFDRSFLNELSEDEWTRHIDTFLNSMTDAVIDQSLQNQPKEIQGQHMAKVMETLKERRQYFKDDMMKYYRFISRTVSVVGTNQREQYTLTKNDDGSIHLVGNKIDKDNNVSSKIYDRVFDPKVTKELRIYGLNDDDRFVFEGGKSPIKVRVIGGAGKDEFINNGTGGTLKIYDASFEENKLTGSSAGIRNKISANPQINSYVRLGYKYNYINPGISADYNVDDGLYLGGRLELVRHGFRKEPYAMRHVLNVNHALQTSSYRFRYQGDFTRLVGTQDLVLRGDFRAPINITNFFGLSNNSVFDRSKPGGIQYYRTRYDLANMSVLLQRNPQSWMKVYYGLAYQYMRLDRKGNSDKFVTDTANNKLDGATLFMPKSFGGLQVGLNINSKNNQIVPTRGLVMSIGAKSMLGLNGHSNNITRFDADLAIFMNLFKFPRLVLATRFGGGYNLGKFEFPQAQYLSGVENLRGYRRDRFAGRSMFYNNMELRVKLAEFKTYLFPGSFGLLAFNDVGRVWADNDSSKDWHVGNGGGIWISPVRRFVVTASVARSKEEKAMPLVTFGFQF